MHATRRGVRGQSHGITYFGSYVRRDGKICSSVKVCETAFRLMRSASLATRARRPRGDERDKVRSLVRRRALMLPPPARASPLAPISQRNQAHPLALCRFRVKESNCTANSSALFGRSGNERSARKAVFARCGRAAPPSTRKTLQREGRKRRSGNKSGPQLEADAVLALYGKSGCSHIGPKWQSCPAFQRSGVKRDEFQRGRRQKAAPRDRLAWRVIQFATGLSQMGLTFQRSFQRGGFGA